MKKLVVVASGRQGKVEAQRRPVCGQDVYIGVDVARSKWVYKVRWDGREQRKLTTPGELRHLQKQRDFYQCLLLLWNQTVR